MQAIVAGCSALFLLFFSAFARGEEAPQAPTAPSSGSAAAALSLVFDESAASLPQTEIRVALERELGVPVALGPSPERPTLRVSVAPSGELLLSYYRPAGALERSLPSPSRSDQIPLLVGLAAGNLVRNQADDLAPKPETPSAREPAAQPTTAPPDRAPSRPTKAPVEKLSAPAPFTHWFGLHVGLDLVPVSVSSACTVEARMNNDFVCFLSDGGTYSGRPNASAAGAVSAGLTAATVPVLLSYEQIFGAFGVEARAGYAFNGGPRPSNGNAFFPARLELRGKFWPFGTIPSTSGFRPYLHLGAGLAQVDAVVHDVSIIDCSRAPASPGSFMANCLAAPDATIARGYGGRSLTVNVVKMLGQAYFTAGGGLAYAVARRHAVVLNLNFMMLLPSTGFALEPSIGYQIGI